MSFKYWQIDTSTGNERATELQVSLTTEVTGLLPAANIDYDNVTIGNVSSTHIGVKNGGIDAAQLNPGVPADWQLLSYDLGTSHLIWRPFTSVVQPCRVVQTTNINTANPGTSVFDGVTLSNGDRVLVVGQTSTPQNGAYVFNGSGSAMTRTTDTNAGTRLASGTLIGVWAGTANANSTWILSTDSAITVGTTGLTFTKLSTAYTGTAPINVTGSVISINANGISNSLLRQGAGLSVIGVTGNATANEADIVGTANQILAVNSAGTSLAFTQSLGGSLFFPSGGIVTGNASAVSYGSYTPTTQIDGGTDATTALGHGRWAADANPARVAFLKSRNASIGSNTALNSGDVVGLIDFIGVNTSPALAQMAKQQTVVDGSPGASFLPSRFEWYTGTNAAAPALNMSLNNAGIFMLSTSTTPLSALSTTPPLQIQSATRAGSIYAQYSADASGSIAFFHKSRGATVGTETGISSGDVMGSLIFTGDNSSNALTEAARIRAITDGAPGASFVPSRLDFWVSNGSAASTNAMSLVNGGQLLLVGSAANAQTVNSIAPNLQLLGTTNATASVLQAQYTADAVGGVHQFFKSRGATVGTITGLNSGDVVGEIDYIGVNSSNAGAIMAKQKVLSDGAPGATFVPSRFEWHVGTNAAAPALAATLTNGGQLLLGTSSTALSPLTVTPPLQVSSNSSTTRTGVFVGQYTADAVGGVTLFHKSRGTSVGTDLAVSSGDVISSILATGVNTSNALTEAARFRFVVDAAPTSSFVPGRIEFWVSGSAASASAMTLTSGGQLVVSSATASQTVNSIAPSLQTLGTTNAMASALHAQYTADAVGATVQFSKSRGAAIGTITATSSGDVVGKLDYWAANANGTSALANAAYQQVVVDGAPGGAFTPGRFEWYTATNASAPALAATLTNGGQFLIGNSTTAQTIGTISSLQLLGTNAGTSSQIIACYAASTISPGITFYKSRGASIGTDTAVNSGDILGTITWYGVNTSPAKASPAFEQVVVDGSPGASFVPGRFEWYTGTASAGPLLAMKLDSTLSLTVAKSLTIAAIADEATTGTELTTNGTFTGNATGWTLNAGWSYNSNNVICTMVSTNTLQQNISVTNGVYYLVAWDQTHSVANNCAITPSIHAVNGRAISFNDTSTHTTNQVIIQSNFTGTAVLAFTPSGGTSGTVTIDNVSVTSITPNAATLTTKDSAGSVTAELRTDTAAQQNLGFGLNSLANLIGGNQNTAFGLGASQNNLAGAFNSAFGNGALQKNTSGSRNSAFGLSALGTNAIGSDNTGVGENAGSGISTGNQNTIIGSLSGQSLTTGSQNVIIGYNLNTPSNTANGQLSIQNMIYGFSNTGTVNTVSTGQIVIGASSNVNSETFQVNKSAGIYKYSADAFGPVLNFFKSRGATYGTIGTAINANDVLADINFYAALDQQGSPLQVANIRVQAAANWVDDGIVGTSPVSFVISSSSPVAGSYATDETKLTIDQNGHMTFGISGSQLLSGGIAQNNRTVGQGNSKDNKIQNGYCAISLNYVSINFGNTLSIGNGAILYIMDV